MNMAASSSPIPAGNLPSSIQRLPPGHGDHHTQPVT